MTLFMGCFWIHEWSKWELKLQSLANGGAMEFQYRRCERCGKYQRESL